MAPEKIELNHGPEPDRPAVGGNNPACSPFIGRKRELAEISNILGQALAGQGQLLMLVGEPGIGKTRMAEEVAGMARARGARTIWGHCYQDEGVPAYWPWVQAIRACVNGISCADLAPFMGRGASDIAELVPEVRELLPGLPPPRLLDDPKESRFRLFDSIAAFLKAVSGSCPLVITLEDLHWADRPSLLLLEFVARELGDCPILLVGTYRDVELSRGSPLLDTMGALARERTLRRVTLRGLEQTDVSQFIQAFAAITPPSDVVEAVCAQTRGNPFFLSEIIRLLQQEGMLAAGSLKDSRVWQAGIPAGVREVIVRRLNRLSESCNDILIAASLFGYEFTFAQLQALHGEQESEKLFDALDEALSIGLIEELPGVLGGHRFSHGLIRNAIMQELSTARRARLHCRIGEALEKTYGEQLAAHAAELAYHFSEASIVIGPEKMVRYCKMAGERALATFAYEEAQTYFQRALQGRESLGWNAETKADSLTADLLFGLGRAQAATLDRNQLRDAITNLKQAFDHYARVGDVERAVAVAEYPIPPSVGGRRTEFPQLITRALSLVPPGSHQEGRLKSRYGYFLGRVEGDYDGASEAFQGALAIARREKDAHLEMRTLVDAASVDVYRLRFQDCIAKGLEAVSLARKANDLRVEVAALFSVTASQTYMGLREEACQLAQEMLASAELLRDRFWLTNALWINENLARLAGDWAAARDFSDRGFAIAPNDPRLLGTRAVLEFQLGQEETGESYLEKLTAVIRRVPPGPTVTYAVAAIAMPWLAYLRRDVEGADVAGVAARAALASRFATPFVARIARVGLGLLAVMQGDARAAGEQYDALGHGLRAISSLVIADDRVMGLLAMTQGKLKLAAAHFENALRLCRQAGYRPELAWACYNYAEALMKEKDKSRAEEAAALLDEALNIAGDLGIVHLQEWAEALQRQRAIPDKTRDTVDGLSQRELEVLRLIALGRSNRDIAEELVISLNTVSHHVTNIFTKLGIANRAEAASYAVRRGLVS